MTVGCVILKAPRRKSVIQAVRADKASATVDNISDRIEAIVILIGCLGVVYNMRYVF